MQYHGPLVSPETLFENLDDDRWVVFDCRHVLADPAAGPAMHRAGHIPGAFHAHVDHDLAGPVGDASHGRHPLPDPAAFEAFIQRHGVDADSQVVVYDEGPGAWAGRLWWLLRFYGHENVALLDGGLDGWVAAGLALEFGHVATPAVPGDFVAEPGHMPTMDADDLEAAEDGEVTLVDARLGERYRGEVEPVDPVAGHIPGAISLPFAGNIGPDGRFLSPDELWARYEGLENVVVYCGSGVTAAQTVLAMEVAGLKPAALYAGSWSEWCRSGRAAATGAEP